MLALLGTGLLLLAIVVALVFVRLQPEMTMHLSLRIARRMLRIRQASIRVAGMRIAYYEAGRGEPLVLLHGMGADKSNFLKVIGPLSRHYRVIVPDLPGFGESDKTGDRDYSVADQVRYLHSFFAELSLERFALGGNSMGGLIAGAYAAAHRIQVSSLWLLAPAGVKSAQESELMKSIAAGADLPILGRKPEDMRRVIAFVTHKPVFVPDFMIRAMALEQDRQYAFNQRIIRELFDGPGLDELLAASELRTPTLIVWGEQDRALDVSGADLLHRLLPRSTVIRMKDTGHVPQLEQPGAIVKDYLAFREREA